MTFRRQVAIQSKYEKKQGSGSGLVYFRPFVRELANSLTNKPLNRAKIAPCRKRTQYNKKGKKTTTSLLRKANNNQRSEPCSSQHRDLIDGLSPTSHHCVCVCRHQHACAFIHTYRYMYVQTRSEDPSCPNNRTQTTAACLLATAKPQRWPISHTVVNTTVNYYYSTSSARITYSAWCLLVYSPG